MTPVFRSRLASGLLAAAVLVPAPLVLLHDRLSGDAEPRAAASPTARHEAGSSAGRRAAEGRVRPGRTGPPAPPADSGPPARTPPGGLPPWEPPARDHGPAAGSPPPDVFPYGYGFVDGYGDGYEYEPDPSGPGPYEWGPGGPGPPEKEPGGGTEAGGTGGATDAGTDTGTGADTGSGTPAAVPAGRTAVRVLPLGTGLLLIGLGLGYIGFRLRRG